MPAIELATSRNERLVVDLDGTQFGFPIGFLEEAFGGLVRRLGPDATTRLETVGDRETRETIKELMGDAVADALPHETSNVGGSPAHPAERFMAATATAMRGRMKRLTMSTRELAARSGLTRAKVRRCVAGDGTLRIDDVASVADALGMSPGNWAEHSGQEPPSGAEPSGESPTQRTTVANDIDMQPDEATEDAVRREIERVLRRRGLIDDGEQIAVIDNPGANPANRTWAAIDKAGQQPAKGTWTLRRHKLLERPNLQMLIESHGKER